MELELKLRIVLEGPPTGIDFGLQSGKGADYQTIEKQRSNGKDLSFNGSVTVKDNRTDGLPNFLGPLAQGPPTARFVYIDVGQYAGQTETGWSRRMKIPLAGIDWAMIEKAANDPKVLAEVRLTATGRDGGPACGTVRPSQRGQGQQGWKLVRA